MVTIDQWRSIKFKNPIVNKAWALVIGHIWKSTRENICETILAKKWAADDWNADQVESKIFSTLNLTKGSSSFSPNPKHKFPVKSPSVFLPPPDGFVKINFYGASKVNPGPTYFGEILRDSGGNPLGTFA